MKRILLIILMLLVFPHVTVWAQEQETTGQDMILEQYRASGMDEVYQVESEAFPEFDSFKIVEDLSQGKSFQVSGILEQVFGFFFGEFQGSLRICLLILVVGFLIGVLVNMQNSFGGRGVSDAGFITAYAVFAGLLVAGFAQVITPAKETIETLSVMIRATIPALITMLTMGGAVMSSGMMASGLLTMVQVIASLIEKLIFPLILGTVALSVASHMSDRINISTTIKTIKQVVKWLLVFTMALFTGIFGVYGLAGSALDSSIGKAARFAVGSGIPVVGGIVADSIETVIGTVGAVRNITGVTGAVTIIAVAAAPLIKTAVVMWLFRLCCAVLEPISDKRLVNLTADIADSICLIFAVLISVCLLFVGCIGIILITGNFVTR